MLQVDLLIVLQVGRGREGVGRRTGSGDGKWSKGIEIKKREEQTSWDERKDGIRERFKENI